MSRIKSHQAREIALAYFRAFTAHTLLGTPRDQFTASGIFTFTCGEEEFVAYDCYHVMDCWDNLYDEHPRATAERIHAAARAILDECYTPDVIAAQRLVMDILDREEARKAESLRRVMNHRLTIAYHGGTGRGRITRQYRRADGIVYQFVGYDQRGALCEVIDSDSLFTLREIVARRMPHAPRCVA